MRNQQKKRYIFRSKRDIGSEVTDVVADTANSDVVEGNDVVSPVLRSADAGAVESSLRDSIRSAIFAGFAVVILVIAWLLLSNGFVSEAGSRLSSILGF